MQNCVQVAVYVDGVRVGVAPASGETPHHIIHRLCELDLARSELEQPPQQVGVGLPPAPARPAARAATRCGAPLSWSKPAVWREWGV